MFDLDALQEVIEAHEKFDPPDEPLILSSLIFPSEIPARVFLSTTEEEIPEST